MADCGYNSRVITKRLLFSQKTNLLESAPFRASDYMTRNRFEAILYPFKYINEESPEYKDPFHEVGKMLHMWNKNIDNYFSSRCIICLDRSISFWYNNYTCPGFIFLPRKPQPYGNKYHITCCKLSGILFGIELFECKYQPKYLVNMAYNNNVGATCGLLLRLKRPIWGSWRA